MPRAPVTTKSSAAAPMARGKGRSISGRTDSSRHEPKECPLCIEPMDATDLSFRPCPCGYPVCLFCYEQIKLLCKGQCPGCRREYGTVPDTGDSVMSDDDEEEEEEEEEYFIDEQPYTSTQASKPSSVAQQARTQPSNGYHSHTSTSSTPARQAVLVFKQPANTVTRKPADQTTNTKRLGTPAGDESPQVALPSGATWASYSRNASSDTEASSSAMPVDEQHWPSLADSSAAAAAAAAATAAVTTKQRQQQDYEHASRRNGVASSSSIDRMGNSSLDRSDGGPQASSSHTAQQHLPRPSHPTHSYHADQALSTLQVAATANGIKRTVVVDLSMNDNPPEPYPEARGLLASMQRAVQSGTITGKDAAAQLLALLRSKEGQPAAPAATPQPQAPQPPQPKPAARGPPPGFGHLPAQQPQPTPCMHPPSTSAPTPDVGSLNNLANPIIDWPAPSRCQPISPPRAPAIDVPTPTPQPQPTTYSMWTHSGLPGIDFSSYMPSGHPLAALWSSASAAVSSTQPSFPTPYVSTGTHDAVSLQASTTSLPSSAAASGSVATRPPPGFGAPPGFGGDAGKAMRPAYQPISGPRYNPLELAGRSGTQGLPTYRPQLGTQLGTNA